MSLQTLAPGRRTPAGTVKKLFSAHSTIKTKPAAPAEKPSEDAGTVRYSSHSSKETCCSLRSLAVAMHVDSGWAFQDQRPRKQCCLRLQNWLPY